MDTRALAFCKCPKLTHTARLEPLVHANYRKQGPNHVSDPEVFEMPPSSVCGVTADFESFRRFTHLGDVIRLLYPPTKLSHQFE